jgi:hypothetical protein
MVKPTLERQFAVGNCHETHSRLRQIISIAMLGIALPVRHWRSLLRSSVCIAASFEDDRMWRGREEKGSTRPCWLWRRSKSAHSFRALASR